ncbi:hypothetical protein K503DRAFT_772523 [Rhizopogon vinicolor AM-OR11-026]|uniref:Arrestin-like N-terminal domain-containing protein n=1 Tax=Rhizopogon vinicolor AM-OR11-026 TaxID=1314800 RepID=A0A1B7MV13_9AGAM|nr:hypothetical protein K503DRAFT_772523 [Rhizopogon vinicolor AM-OR11-026]
MEGDHELPGYTPRVGSSQTSHNVLTTGSEHTISLEDNKGHKWLFLSVRSRAPTPDSLPAFYAGDVISGNVTLDILKSESSKAIMLKVTAGTTLVGQEEQQFLVIEKELWSPTTALPDGSKVSKLEKCRHAWPFEMTLPKETEVLDRKEKKIFHLPPSFTERASPAYINYKLTVVLKRGALRVNQILTTDFAYVPITRPDLPSPMLQKAYKENIPLIGPEGDPEGWHILPTTSVTGTLFGTKSVNVDFTLALPKPLSYARGSAMPLRLTFTGADEQALDLLSSPLATRVILKRSLATGSDAMSEDAGKHTDNFFVEIMARAVFWPARESSTTGKRVLEGEVKLKSTFKQSIVFPRFVVRYHLEVHPFEVAGFMHAPPVSGPLLAQLVNVTSFHAAGAVMRSFAPPEYAHEENENFNNSVGLLENGNQRFYHHGGLGLA